VYYSFLGLLVRVTAQRVVQGAGNNTNNQQSTTKYLVEKHKVQQVSWLHGQLAELAVVVVQLGTQWSLACSAVRMQWNAYAVQCNLVCAVKETALVPCLLEQL
jgi:hypothetical protein